MLKNQIEDLKNQIIAHIPTLTTREDVEVYELKMLSRKGEMTLLMKGIADVPLAEKAELGVIINTVKQELTVAFSEKKATFGSVSVENDAIDVTLPGIEPPRGSLHPVTHAIEEIEDIFSRLGFRRVRYPEIEWDYYAFEALNMPADHPARDEWETFFISEKPVGPMGRLLLTPHTSSGQVREMQKYSADGLGVRMLNIAKTYRRQIDLTHTPMFHQFEGLVVDRDITITQLIGTLDHFVKEFFSPDRKIRLRPFHFRFTEPSFEVDISCGLCDGKGCSYCKQGWSEIGGAGMVHPNVLTAGGYDPKKFTGFAFGFGVERTYLMKNQLNIGDLRMLYGNDIRFLEQF